MSICRGRNRNDYLPKDDTGTHCGWHFAYPCTWISSRKTTIMRIGKSLMPSSRGPCLSKLPLIYHLLLNGWCISLCSNRWHPQTYLVVQRCYWPGKPKPTPIVESRWGSQRWKLEPWNRPSKSLKDNASFYPILHTLDNTIRSGKKTTVWQHKSIGLRALAQDTGWS